MTHKTPAPAETVSRAILFTAALCLLLTVASLVAAQKLTFTEQPFSILAPLAGDFTQRQAAASVLGQPNFTTNSPGTTASKFNTANGAVVDPVSGKAFVVDQSNNRVLRFASPAALTSGAAAEAVFGQADFVTGTAGLAANKFITPRDISIDAAGRLWVADTGSNRVLRFDNAATVATNPSANAVLGQLDFVTNTSGATQSKFNNPNGVFADASGTLWVADTSNSRVLRFDAAATKANGAAADAVLGQPDFTTASAGITASKMNNPYGVTLDAGGRLWVADGGNNRVLRFDGAATKANGAAADVVLGQPNFTTNSAAASAVKMSFPTGVTTDANGRLYVADFGNNRVIIFNSAATLANGAAANVVLGQPDFTTVTSNSGGVSAISMASPLHLFYSETTNSLFVAERTNNRVLRFAAPAAPTAATVTVSGRVTLGWNNRAVARATVQMTGADGVLRRATTNPFGYYRFVDVAAGETYIFNVKAKARGSEFAIQVVTVNEDVNDLNFTGN